MTVINSSLRAATHPRFRPEVAGVLLVLAIAVVIGLISTSYWLFALNTCLIAAVGALGLNMLTGFAGQISIGTAALLAVGGYMAVPLAGHIGFVPTLIVAMLTAGAVGALAGLPAVRLRGLYLAISTIALQFIVIFILQNVQTRTGAISGYDLPIGSIGGWRLESDRSWTFLLLIVVSLFGVLVTAIVRGKIGRAWVAIRERDIAAAIIGVNVTGYKLLAFTCSSMLIGLSGALFAFYQQSISYEQFSFDISVSYVAMIIIGGLGSVSGSLIGAFVVTGLPYVVQHLATSVFGVDSSGWLSQNLPLINVIVYGVLVLLFLRLEPRGISWLAARVRSSLFGRPALPTEGVADAQG
jgi:branched-chain amino acid transport system permease protein